MNILIAVILLISVVGMNEYIKKTRIENEICLHSGIFEVLYFKNK